jgi:DNA-binding XRE family transcriptional regulator
MNNKKRLENRHLTNRKFAKTVKQIRAERNLTLQAVGKLVGTTRQAMYTLETGKGVHFHTAVLLAKALDIDLNDFK